MYTQLLSPEFSLPQPFLRAADSNKQSSHREEKVDDQHKRQGRLSDDSYQPSKRLEQAGSGTASSTMTVNSIATSIEHSAEIQITTKEGDVVTISLNESEVNSRSAFQAEQGDSKVTAYSESRSIESGFSISIEGDLNEDEQKSLADLINKMSKVSEKFFNGNVQSAFKHAQNVGFDTEQITGFSMELRKEKSVQAVTAYQQTRVPEQSIKPDLLKQAADFIAETKVMMADTNEILDSFYQPKQAFSDLFSGVSHMNVADSKPENEQALFLKMIENIGNDLFDNRG